MILFIHRKDLRIYDLAVPMKEAFPPPADIAHRIHQSVAFVAVLECEDCLR
ncbi:hypothetical protein [Paenibacillus puerhi]|uniref:hypothetical protein n=1 Tax=Paenibacillus puerhi TaxID=2692622 RepID=UPI0013590F80|nr:hypothetical protein [Paenibacillus puerhi]